jgi:tetratricopeptide (TPR) repeat protein
MMATGLLLFAHIVLFSVTEITDPDAWGHALLGHILIEKGRIPSFSDYSWMLDDTTPRPYVCSIQIVLYLVLHYGGYQGLLILRCVILSLICYFLWRLLQLHSVPWPIYIVCSILFLVLGHGRFLPRGDFFNLLFLVIYFYALERFLQRPGKWILWMTLLQAVWSNIHQLSPLGVCLVGMYVAYSYVRRDWRSGHRLLGLACLCAAALLVTPAGYGQLVQTWQMAIASPESKELMSRIGEFMSLPETCGPLLELAYWITLACILSLAIINKQWRDLHYLALVLVLAWGSWRHVRLLGMFALCSAYLLGKAIWLCWQRHGNLCPRLLVRLSYCCIVGMQIVLAVALVSGRFFVWNEAVERCHPQPPNAYLPVEAVKFLQQYHIDGNIYTDYAGGSYVSYHLYPAARTFVHSLNLYYSLENYRLYCAIADGKVNPASVILPYDIQLFVLNHPLRQNYRLIRWLYHAPGWLLVYADESTVVFASEQSQFVQKNRLVGLLPEAIWRQSHIANSPINLADIGFLLLDLNYPDEALAAAREALRLDSKQAAAANILGMVAFMRGDWHTALQRFVESAEQDPSYTAPRQNIHKLFAQCINFQPDNPLHLRARKVAGW